MDRILAGSRNANQPSSMASTSPTFGKGVSSEVWLQLQVLEFPESAGFVHFSSFILNRRTVVTFIVFDHFHVPYCAVERYFE